MLSASLLRQRRPSVCLSVCLSHCCVVSKRRNSWSWNLHCGLPQGLAFVTNFRAAGWGDSARTRASNKGTPLRKKVVILPLLARLAWKRLQIDTDMLLIITSTADELSGCTNIDDLERPWTSKIGVLSDFLLFLAAAHTYSEFLLKYTGDRPIQPAYNWCCRAFHEH